MTSLYELRGVDLGADALKLAPFILSYRPHSEVPNSKMLKEEGYELVEKESFWDEFYDYYIEAFGCTPEERMVMEMKEFPAEKT
jgi:hypothetical protein